MQADRRTFLWNAAAATAIIPQPSISHADDEDLTSKLFNPDGSLKNEDMPIEAKSRSVSIQWDVSEGKHVAIDGKTSEEAGNTVISYTLPLKWATGESGDDPLYLDRSEGVNAPACQRISVFQAPGKASVDRLQKATNIGVSKALDLEKSLPGVVKADLVGGRTRVENGQKYWDFTMAVAPKTCESSAENLGLGFCPFEAIYLLSSTVFDDKLFVMVIECDKDQWKRANSDLKRVQSSFAVQAAT